MVLDTPAKPSFDRLTRLSAQLLEAQIALITLVDADRQFFLSAFGLPEPFRSTRQTPLEYSVCQHAVMTGRPFIVEDIRADAGLVENRTVTALGVNSYAGIPLFTGEGHA